MRVFRVVVWALFVCFGLTEAAAPSATVYIPMRDGKELTADLYYPSGSVISNDFPCILLRLPGGRRAEPWVQLADLAQEGYVVAIQDTRSALDPEGKTLPYISDGWGEHQDGYDTINWLANSSFTNGKIGTVGFSAAGVTQLMLAPTAPSPLKCQYIGQAASSLYHHAIFAGGQFQKNQVESWLGLYASHPSVLQLITSRPVYDEFWQKFDSGRMAHQVNVPAVHYGGWYDPFLKGTIEAFIARQENGGVGAREQQKLLIGPWNHFWPQDFSLGDFQVPENGKHPPLDLSMKRWFDHHLRDIKSEVADISAVTYFVMGPFDGSSSSGNVWRQAEKWPVPAVETHFYLGSNRSLSETLASKELSFTYESDPENPVPTIGGRNLFLPSGPKDQRPIESRKDVLVFTTLPLQEDLEATGMVRAKVYLTADVPDADVVVRLTDVYPDGKSVLIAEGLTHSSEISSDHPKEVMIDLWSTSIVFAKGHAIRISIAGSNYPAYEKSPRKAICRVHIGGKTPSCLSLPVVRKGGQRP